MPGHNGCTHAAVTLAGDCLDCGMRAVLTGQVDVRTWADEPEDDDERDA